MSDNAVATEAGGTLNGTAGSNPSGNVLSNDTDVDSGDTKAVSGVAAGSIANTSGSVGSSVTGSYGAITINADGSYSYIVNNSNAAVQGLEFPPLASVLEDNHQGFRSANVEEIAAEWSKEKAVDYLDQILQPAAIAWTFDNLVVGQIGESVIESTWVDGTEDYEINEHERIYVGFMDCENLPSLKSLTDILFGSRSSLVMKSSEQNSELTAVCSGRVPGKSP